MAPAGSGAACRYRPVSGSGTSSSIPDPSANNPRSGGSSLTVLGWLRGRGVELGNTRAKARAAVGVLAGMHASIYMSGESTAPATNDELHRKQPGLQSRAEAIRRLMELALIRE